MGQWEIHSARDAMRFSAFVSIRFGAVQEVAGWPLSRDPDQQTQTSRSDNAEADQLAVGISPVAMAQMPSGAQASCVHCVEPIASMTSGRTPGTRRDPTRWRRQRRSPTPNSFTPTRFQFDVCSCTTLAIRLGTFGTGKPQ